MRIGRESHGSPGLLSHCVLRADRAILPLSPLILHHNASPFPFSVILPTTDTPIPEPSLIELLYYIQQAGIPLSREDLHLSALVSFNLAPFTRILIRLVL